MIAEGGETERAVTLSSSSAEAGEKMVEHTRTLALKTRSLCSGELSVLLYLLVLSLTAQI